MSKVPRALRMAKSSSLDSRRCFSASSSRVSREIWRAIRFHYLGFQKQLADQPGVGAVEQLIGRRQHGRTHLSGFEHGLRGAVDKIFSQNRE